MAPDFSWEVSAKVEAVEVAGSNRTTHFLIALFCDHPVLNWHLHPQYFACSSVEFGVSINISVNSLWLFHVFFMTAIYYI